MSPGVIVSSVALYAPVAHVDGLFSSVGCEVSFARVVAGSYRIVGMLHVVEVQIRFGMGLPQSTPVWVFSPFFYRVMKIERGEGSNGGWRAQREAKPVHPEVILAK